MKSVMKREKRLKRKTPAGEEMKEQRTVRSYEPDRYEDTIRRRGSGAARKTFASRKFIRDGLTADNWQ